MYIAHVVLAMDSHHKNNQFQSTKKQLQKFHKWLQISVQMFILKSVEIFLWVFLEKTGNETRFLGFDRCFQSIWRSDAFL